MVKKKRKNSSDMERKEIVKEFRKSESLSEKYNQSDSTTESVVEKKDNTDFKLVLWLIGVVFTGVVVAFCVERYFSLFGFTPLSALVFILMVFVFGEVLFWMFDNTTPRNLNDKKVVFWHTAQRKLVNFGWAFIIVSIVTTVAELTYKLFRWIGDWVKLHSEIILQILKVASIWLLLIALVVALFIGFIKLNALKYKKKIEHVQATFEEVSNISEEVKEE